jgi:hypothetical protein
MAPLAFQKTRKQGVIWVCQGIRGPSADAIGKGPIKVERVCTLRPIHAPIIKPSRRHSPRLSFLNLLHQFVDGHGLGLH